MDNLYSSIFNFNELKERLAEHELSREESTQLKSHLSRYMIEGYNIADEKIKSASKVARRYKRLLSGEDMLINYEYIATAINGLKREIPILDRCLLYHLVCGSTPEQRSCRFFDINECKESPLLGKLITIEYAFKQIERDLNALKKSR